MFVILRIITCMLEALLPHFSYLSWIWQRYKKHLPLGNYIFHLSIQKLLCFQLSHLHKVFTCFRHKASIFPSSWSSLWCLFQPRDKDRRQSKFGRMILRGEMPCWFIRKVKHLLFFFTNLFLPFSFVAAVLNQPTDEDRGFACAGGWNLLLIYRPLLLLCNAACSTLKKYPLLWMVTDSILFLLGIDLHKTASRSSLITMKNSITNAWQESWDYP